MVGRKEEGRKEGKKGRKELHDRATCERDEGGGMEVGGRQEERKAASTLSVPAFLPLLFPVPLVYLCVCVCVVRTREEGKVVRRIRRKEERETYRCG